MAERAVNTDSGAQRLLVLQRSSIQLGENKQEACINLPIVLRCREHGQNCSNPQCSVLSGVGLCDPMDCSPPGSSVHGIFQAGILEWVVICYSRGFPNPEIESASPALAGRFFTPVSTGKPIYTLPCVN